MERQFKVCAIFDQEADVWTVVESELPGLVAEAPTLSELEDIIEELAPELLELNAHLLPKDSRIDVPIALVANYENLLRARHIA